MDHSKLTRLAADVARGKDVESFGSTVGWEDILLPQLLRDRATVVQSLVQTLLDAPGTQDKLATACGQAGIIHGIDTIIRNIEAHIATGRKSYASAVEAGFIPKV